MFVFTPVAITESNMTSTIPEPDTSVGEVVWDVGSTYNTGDRAIKTSTHLLYQSAIDSNTEDPEVGVNSVPPTWVEVSATNKFRMFDEVGNTQSTSDTPITIELTPGVVLTSVACFNLDDSESINITMTDPVAGEVYNKDVDLRDSTSIFSWYDYFFEPIINLSEFVITDLPPYKNATLSITFNSSSPTVGVLAAGKQVELGVAEYGTAFSLNDYSTVDTDDFGYATITKRDTSKQVDFSGYCETQKAQYVFERLSDTTGLMCIWYGSGEKNDSTLVYGYYSDSTITISNPQTTSFSLSIEGII